MSTCGLVPIMLTGVCERVDTKAGADERGWQTDRRRACVRAHESGDGTARGLAGV